MQTINKQPQQYQQIICKFLLNLPQRQLEQDRLWYHYKLAYYYYIDCCINIKFTQSNYQQSNKQQKLKQLFSKDLKKYLPQYLKLRINSMEICEKKIKKNILLCGIMIMNQQHTKVLLVNNVRTIDKYGFPKGKISQGENPLQSAIRQVYQQTGLKIQNLSKFRVYSGRYQYLYCFIGFIKQNQANLNFSTKQIYSVKWFPINQSIINNKYLNSGTIIVLNQIILNHQDLLKYKKFIIKDNFKLKTLKDIKDNNNPQDYQIDPIITNRQKQFFKTIKKCFNKNGSIKDKKFIFYMPSNQKLRKFMIASLIPILLRKYNHQNILMFYCTDNQHNYNDFLQQARQRKLSIDILVNELGYPYNLSIQNIYKNQLQRQIIIGRPSQYFQLLNNKRQLINQYNIIFYIDSFENIKNRQLLYISHILSNYPAPIIICQTSHQYQKTQHQNLLKMINRIHKDMKQVLFINSKIKNTQKQSNMNQLNYNYCFNINFPSLKLSTKDTQIKYAKQNLTEDIKIVLRLNNLNKDTIVIKKIQLIIQNIKDNNIIKLCTDYIPTTINQFNLDIIDFSFYYSNQYDFINQIIQNACEKLFNQVLQKFKKNKIDYIPPVFILEIQELTNMNNYKIQQETLLFQIKQQKIKNI